MVLRRLGNRSEAEALLREALERRLKLSNGEDDPEISRLQNNLSSFLSSVGREDEARELTRASLSMARRIYPEGHPDLVTTITNYAFLKQNQRCAAEAEALAREAYTTGLAAVGEEALPAATFRLSRPGCEPVTCEPTEYRTATTQSSLSTTTVTPAPATSSG